MEKREQIIAEYLTGSTSYRKLGTKYGIDFRVIHSWVMSYQGKNGKKVKSSALKQSPPISECKEIELLKKELATAQLHAKLLNTIIDIAEKEFKIDIRKKSGTKR